MTSASTSSAGFNIWAALVNMPEHMVNAIVEMVTDGPTRRLAIEKNAERGFGTRYEMRRTREFFVFSVGDAP